MLLITMSSPEIFECIGNLACPYFMPVAKLESGNWQHPARLPLGSGWSGHCTAPAHQGELPSQSTLESFCNLGYANGCSWSPQDRRWDAVRFAVSAPSAVADRAGEPIAFETQARTLRLAYVCERDHHPVANGWLEFDLSQAAWLRQHEDSRIQKMAECFLDSYLKTRS
ncbi:MAG: hypothetical protein ACRD3B_08845 [Candidatus Sulfotelmatobacter sp.]